MKLILVIALDTITSPPISLMSKVTVMTTAPPAKTGMQTSLGVKTLMMNGASLTTTGATFRLSVKDLSQQFTLKAQIMRISSTGSNAKRNKLKLAAHLNKTMMALQTLS